MALEVILQLFQHLYLLTGSRIVRPNISSLCMAGCLVGAHPVERI